LADPETIRADATAYRNYAIYWSPSSFFVPGANDFFAAADPVRGPLFYYSEGAYVYMIGPSRMAPQIGVSMPAYLTGGFIPKARHIYLNYKVYSADLVPGSISIFNGPTLVFTKTYPTSGWTENTVYLDDIDMGKYSVFNRGFHMEVVLLNNGMPNRGIMLYGAGVRMEW
jgi:hypothetical protein